MKHIIDRKDLPHERASQGTNGDYPEISFTFISQVITGLMGISVNAANDTITVKPHLPDEIDYIKLSGLKLLNRTADIVIDKENVSIQ